MPKRTDMEDAPESGTRVTDCEGLGKPRPADKPAEDAGGTVVAILLTGGAGADEEPSPLPAEQVASV